MNKLKLLTFCIPLSLAITACNDGDKVSVTKDSGQTMGTFYNVTVINSDKQNISNENLNKIAHESFNKVIDAISSFDKNSEISKFNKHSDASPFYISDYLATVIENARASAHDINDAMDITVAPLVNLWGFGPTKRLEKAPSKEQIDEALSYVGYDKFGLYYENDSTKAYLIKKTKGVQLDLSTIGEGLGADLLAERLDSLGFNNYLIAVAGAIRSKGKNAKHKDWAIGIEDPRGNGVYQKVCPHNMAMSTAGSYRNFFLDKNTNEFYSHIIDPTTGYPVKHKTVSVTVIDNTAATTDALDTGLLVLGAKKAIEFGNRTNTAVYAIEIDDKGDLKATYSKAFEQYLKCDLNDKK